MSWPSMTHVEFIRPMNFSISSSDLKQNIGTGVNRWIWVEMVYGNFLSI